MASLKSSNEYLNTTKGGFLDGVFIRHLEYLQDASMKLGPISGAIILTISMMLHLLFLNNSKSYTLNWLNDSGYKTTGLVLLIAIIPLLLLMLMGALIWREQNFRKRNKNQKRDEFNRNVWFSIYKHIYQVHFFIIEPLIFGGFTSTLLNKNPWAALKHNLPNSVKLLVTVSVIIGLCQSVLYGVFVLGLLPGKSLFSASSRMNSVMISLSLKVSIIVIPFIPSLTSNSSNDKTSIGITRILILVFLKNIPSLIAIPYNINRIFFFNNIGRIVSTSYHAFLIMVSVVYSIVDNMEPVLISKSTNTPILLFGALAFKIIVNFDSSLKNEPINPETCNLSSVLEVAHELRSALKGCEDDSRRMSILNRIAGLTQNRDKTYNAYLAWLGKDAMNPEVELINIVMYLFHRLYQREPHHRFKIVIYHIYYLMQLNLSLYHLAILLDQVREYQATIYEVTTYKNLKKHIESKLEEISSERRLLRREDAYFYSSGDRNTRNYTSKISNLSPNSNKFNVYGALVSINLLEGMICKTTQAINKTLGIYEKLSRRSTDNSNIHEIVSQINRKKSQIDGLFLQLEESRKKGAYQNVFHLLPYGLFMDRFSNDRLALKKYVKLYRDRTHAILRHNKKSKYDGLIQGIDLDSMILLTVKCARIGLGDIIYASKNNKEVFGVDHAALQKMNIGDFLSDSFKPIHSALMYSFVHQHDKNYLGMQKRRYIKLGSVSVFNQVNIVVSLSPVFSEDINFTVVIHKEKTQEGFLVTNMNGSILGYNQVLAESMPQIPYFLRSNLSMYSQDLADLVGTLLLNHLQSMSISPKKLMDTIKGTCELAMISPKRVLLIEKIMNENNRVEILTRERLPDNTGGWLAYQVCVKLDPLITTYSDGVFMEVVIRISVLQKSCAYLKSREVVSPFARKINSPYFSGDDLTPTTWQPRCTELHYSVLGGMPLTVSGKTVFTYQGPDEDSLKVVQLNKSNTDHYQKDYTFLEDETRLATIEIINLRNKLNKVLTKQMGKYVWREKTGILLVQVFVWTLSIYIVVLMDRDYYSEMTNLIELRKGFMYFSMGNANFWGAGSLLFEKMFLSRGLIQYNQSLLKSFTPNYNRDVMVEFSKDYRLAQDFTLSFQRHIYSFDWKYSNRYTFYKTNFTMRYSDNLVEPIFTKETDLVDCYKLLLYNLRRWRKAIDNVEPDAYIPQEFTNMIGPSILEKIGGPTVLLLLDLDDKKYQALTKKTERLIGISILISILLTTAIIFLILLIRKKIVFIYTAFERLYDFEVCYAIDNLNRLKKMLLMSLESEKALEMIIYNQKNKSRTNPAYNYYQKSQLHVRSRKAGQIRFCRFFELITLALVVFSFIEVFNLATYLVLRKVSGNSQYKLEMLTYSRATLTGGAWFHNYMFKIYPLLLTKMGLSGNAYSDTALMASQRAAIANLEIQFRRLDQYAATYAKVLPQVESVGLDLFNHPEPCDFVNMTEYNLTMEQCRKIGDGAFSRTPIEIFRWMRFKSGNLLPWMETITSTNATDLLNNPEFKEVQFVKRAFAFPFLLNFNIQFYEKLLQLHDRTAYYLRVVLTVMLVIFISLAIVLNTLGYLQVRRHVSVSLSSLLLLPTECFIRNPNISGMLIKLS